MCVEISDIGLSDLDDDRRRKTLVSSGNMPTAQFTFET